MRAYSNLEKLMELGGNTVKKLTNFLTNKNNAIITKTRKEYLLGHCQTIDISEAQVFDFVQATAFNYYAGINSCYRNTPADPYYNVDKKKRSIRYKNNEWKEHLMAYGT